MALRCLTSPISLSTIFSPICLLAYHASFRLYVSVSVSKNLPNLVVADGFALIVRENGERCLRFQPCAELTRQCLLSGSDLVTLRCTEGLFDGLSQVGYFAVF